MTKVISARIRNGQIVPDEPLPESLEGRHVSIHIDVPMPTTSEAKAAALARLRGLLKNAPMEDPKQSYLDYLEEKYR